uniref:HAD-like protein n=1 Tax=Panagrellus redivivus TaxID=6233 RepID=A0A7E4VMS9_PANRE
MAPITHVIFDYDGVLQDTERAYSLANDVTLKHFGRSFNNTLKSGMMGRCREDAVQWVLHQTGIADTVTTAEYNEIYDRVLQVELANAPLLPGVVKLVEHLLKHNIPIAVCTGSDEREFAQKTPKLAEFISKFENIVLAGSDSEVKRGKPAPDPYIVTMKRFTIPPKTPANVLVFEDSINGARSGLAAGCATVFVPQKEFITHDWEERIIDIKPLLAATVDSLTEVDLDQFELPGYDE